MTYSFCPKCGNPLQDKSDAVQKCLKCDFVYYNNAKPTSSAVIVKDDKVLLGKRLKEPSKGMWDVIGGFTDQGEHPEVALKREVLEETGLIVEPVSFVGIFMDTYGDNSEFTLNIAYEVKVVGGSEHPGDDIGELRWFSLEDLPEIAFVNGEEILNAYKAQIQSKASGS